MDGPYLESGESIVLTTDRVSINTVMYQAMLTTRRLILIDSRNARFDPQVVSLSAIQTVRSGKAATGDPVIILTLQEPEPAGTNTRVIIFSQEPAENRKPDRDLWVKTVIELSVSGRETVNERDFKTPEGRGGMRPTVRRWVAPDITRPRTENFPVKEPAPEITISMDEPEPVAIADLPSALAVALAPDDDGRDEDGGQGYQDFLVRATRTAVHFLDEPEPEVPAHLPAPLQTGDETPEPAGVSPPPAGTGFTAPDTSSPLSVSILAAAKSLTGSKPPGAAEPAPYPPGDEDPSSDEFPEIPYENPVRFTSRLPDNLESHPAFETTESSGSHPPPGETDSAEIIPVPGVAAAGIRSTSQLPEFPHHTQEPPGSSSSPLVTDPVEPEVNPEPAIEESSSDETLHTREEETVKYPDPTETREIPPARPGDPREAPAPGGISLLVIGGSILCLLLVIAGVLILPGLHPPDSGQGVIIPTPVMTPAVVLTPSSTTPSIPANGTWVRIVSPGYFIGQLGNPGSLQQVSGSGEKWFRVRESTGLVKVSVEKQEYSGDTLRLEIYSEGRVITSRGTSAPQGSVDLLIDPATGEAPGITETPNPAGTGSGRLDYL